MIYKHACMTGALALSLLAVSSCSDDDKWGTVDGKEPNFAVTSEHVMTDLGRDVHFAGKITDADGIASIKLSCPALSINKTIDLIEIYGAPQTEYDLDYSVRMRNDIEGESFDVEIAVTDVAGNTVKKNVLVTLDGDFSAPVFETSPDKEVTVLYKENPTFNLSFAVRDNREIDYVTVDVEGVDGFPVTVQGNGQNRVEFARKLELPTAIADYNLTVTAYDKAAQEGEVRSTVVNSVIKVSELPDWSVIYLADVATAAELNSDVFGVPMAMDHVGEYKYRVRYYNEKAGTQICFIPQKTDFGPICFGPDPADPAKLGDDPESVGRVTLDKAGVYYLINVNTFERTVTLDTYSVNEAVNPVMHLHYGQNDLNTWWETTNMGDIWWQEWFFGPGGNPDQITAHMEQDKNNPHIYYYDWKLSEGTERFQIANWHSHGWWNFTAWRVDDSDDASKCMFYGNYHPTTPHYESNDDYFKFKYIDIDPEEYKFMYPSGGQAFDLGKWGDEGYRKNFVPDNWINAKIPAEGNYRIIFDLHAERIKMIPN